MILETIGLTKNYMGHLAVNNVSLSVKEGERCAIIGPNGAGKSTFFNMICGEKSVTRGDILFNGKKITHLPGYKRVRLGIGRTFQITSIFTGLTAQENVQLTLFARYRRELSFFRRAKTELRDEATEIINSVGLMKQRSDLAGSLSHGDRRLLDLAMALASKPKLLLLDEPTQGMAPADGVKIMELIRDIAEKNKLTIIFTEHDMNIVFSIATELVVMHQGEILARGKPEEVRRNPEVQGIYLRDENH